LIGVSNFLQKDHGCDIVTKIELVCSTEGGAAD
jgi:hypothetical protein